MATTTPTEDTYDCPRCERETPHEVSLTVRSTGTEKYSREPHRVRRCTECGHVEERHVWAD